jgi:hypothetical protein
VASLAPEFPAGLVHDGVAPDDGAERLRRSGGLNPPQLVNGVALERFFGQAEQGVSFLKDVGWGYAGSHRQPLLSSQMIFAPSPATPVMP